MTVSADGGLSSSSSPENKIKSGFDEMYETGGGLKFPGESHNYKQVWV